MITDKFIDFNYTSKNIQINVTLRQYSKMCASNPSGLCNQDNFI